MIEVEEVTAAEYAGIEHRPGVLYIVRADEGDAV